MNGFPSLRNWKVSFFIWHFVSHYCLSCWSGPCRGSRSKFEGFFQNLLQKGIIWSCIFPDFMCCFGLPCPSVHNAYIEFRSLKLILKSLRQIIGDLIQRKRIWLTYIRSARVTWTGMFLMFMPSFLQACYFDFELSFPCSQALLFNALFWS